MCPSLSSSAGGGSSSSTASSRSSMQHELTLGVEADADQPGAEQRLVLLDRRRRSSSTEACRGSSGSSSAMRSRNCSASAASSATCSFSTSTDSIAAPLRAWITNVRAPGAPNAPAPIVVDGIELDEIGHVAPPSVRASGSGSEVVEAAGVVALHEQHAVGVEVEHRHRRRATRAPAGTGRGACRCSARSPT